MDPLLTTNLQIYKDTENFISLYKQPQLKEYIDDLIDRGIKATFKGRPLIFYAKIIALSAQKKALDTGARAEYPKLYQNAIRSPQELKNLFTRCTQTEQQVVGFLRLAAQDQIGAILSRPDLAAIQTADKMAPSPQKEQHYLNWVSKKDQSEEVIKKPLTLPRLSTPSIAKNFFSSFQMGARKLIIRFGPNLLSGAIGGITGLSLGGPVGSVIGVMGGGFMPQIVKSGAARGLIGGALRGGGGLILRAGGGLLAATNPVGWAILASSLLPKKGKTILKWVIIGVAGFIMLPFFMSLLQTTSFLPPAGVGEAAPGLPPGSVVPGGDLDKKCDFSQFNIFQSSAVSSAVLQKYVDRALATGKVKPGDQTNRLSDRARYIRDAASGAGLNPAIFLGYWESESAFSDYSHPGVRPGMDLGCDPLNKAITSFEEDVLCAVGKSSISNSRTSQCAISKNKNGAACQAILFQESEGVVLPINTLGDFLNSYGSKVSDPNNIQSDAIVKQTIADLGLVSCTAAPTQAICPIPNGTVTCGSVGTGGIAGCENGHCGAKYDNPANICSLVPATAYAVDIGGSPGQEVLMPTLTDPQTGITQSLNCTFLGQEAGIEGDTINRFGCQDNIWIRFHHLQSGQPAKTVKSGELVGKIANSAGGPHVHIQLGIGGECTGSNTSYCKAADSYIKCK
ncbi:hypothetical protein HY385_01650 [Candidatus Daviesbacteria bacterium]|nr:hypothetical protein [Candidatus Daviesbacteria bacterium]